MKTIECEQRSDAWYEARAGVPSASEFDMIITSKGERSKQREKYMFRLAGERVCGKPEETYQSAAMLRGIELEDEARNLYSFITGNAVEKVGFCVTEGKTIFGCSPDGLVGKNGLIEIKCPEIHTHVEYLLENALPTKYFQQVQGQLLVTEREWCDFVSHYQGIKPMIVRVYRDEIFLEKLYSELVEFCQELDAIVNRIK